MVATAVLFVIAAVQIALYATLTAVVLNLPHPIGIRIIILSLGFWCYCVLRVLQRINRSVIAHNNWLRLIFITLHIQNESENLEPARDRMQSDIETERLEVELSGGQLIKPLTAVAGFVVFIITTILILNYGWLGDFGYNLARDIHGSVKR